MQMVGIDIAMYRFLQLSMNRSKIGSTIKPIDQKNSNTKIDMVFASPLVISPPNKRHEFNFKRRRQILLMKK